MSVVRLQLALGQLGLVLLELGLRPRGSQVPLDRFQLAAFLSHGEGGLLQAGSVGLQPSSLPERSLRLQSSSARPAYQSRISPNLGHCCLFTSHQN